MKKKEFPSELNKVFTNASVIGQGGMATVWKAYCPKQKTDVAVKVMSSELYEDPTFLQRFQLEAELASKEIHRALIKIFDTGETATEPYLVMELIEGQSLRELINKKAPIDETLCRKIVKELSDCLLALHENGIIHRGHRETTNRLFLYVHCTLCGEKCWFNNE